MKNIRIILALIIFSILQSCGNNDSGKDVKADTTANSTDTITDITNPGAGSVSDDTAAKP